jgi:hypothetical protein
MRGSLVAYQSLRMAEDMASEYDPEIEERAPACGATSANLSRRVIAHLPCDRDRDHSRFCVFEAL